MFRAHGINCALLTGIVAVPERRAPSKRVGVMDNDKKLIRYSTAEFLIFTAQAGQKSIEARYEHDNVWMSQKPMAALFSVDVRTVSEHLKNVYTSGELARAATIREFRIVQVEGERQVARNVYARDQLREAESRGYRERTKHNVQMRGQVLNLELSSIRTSRSSVLVRFKTRSH